jgi:hypothetical protein
MTLTRNTTIPFLKSALAQQNAELGVPEDEQLLPVPPRRLSAYGRQGRV